MGMNELLFVFFYPNQFQTSVFSEIATAANLDCEQEFFLI